MENKLRRSKQIIVSFLVIVLGFTFLFIEESFAASKKIQLNTASSFKMYPGEVWTERLINGNRKIKATKVRWKSAKPTVAKINKKGKIKALKTGTAKMSAKYKGKTYRFTVKVKDPLKGKKPTKFKLDDYYESLGEIALRWDGRVFNEIPKYQIYVSIDDGAYKLYKTTGDWYCHYNNIEEGVKYSFKVRAVLGKCKSSFTEVKSFCYEKKNNETIIVEPENISLTVGDSVDVKVITDKGASVTFSSNNNNVKCAWGEWISGTNSLYLKITGQKAGETVVSVYDTEDNSVNATIKVICTTIPEADLKSQCITRDYRSLLRNASYGEYTKIYGKVIQDCGNGNYRITSGGSSNDEVYYVTVVSGFTLVEKDWVNCYGLTNGIKEYITVMGNTQKVPWLTAHYVQLLN